MGQINLTATEINRRLTEQLPPLTYENKTLSPIADLFLGASQKVSESAMCNALTTWLEANATTTTGAFTSVRYVDPVNGSDSNNGRSPLSPIKTLSAAPAANQAFAIKGGTTLAYTTSMLPGAGCLLVGYDTDEAGQPVITGESITTTGDKNRTIRIQNANVILANLAIKGPIGDGSSGNNVIQCGTGGSGLTLLGNTIYANPGAETIGLATNNNFDFLIEHNHFKTTWGIGLGVPSGLTKPQYIRFNKFESDITGTTNWCFDNGDAITLGDPAGDWQGWLRIMYNEFISWNENAIDCNKASGAFIGYNSFNQLNKVQLQASIGILMGSSTISATKNIVIGNYFHDFVGAGVYTRGCNNGIIAGNIFARLHQGIASNITGTVYNRIYNNTLYDLYDQTSYWTSGQIISPYTTSPGSHYGIRVENDVDYTEVYNNIIHMRNSGEHINNMGGANCKFGANVYAGSVYPNKTDMTNRLVAPDLYVQDVSKLLDITTYKPTKLTARHRAIPTPVFDSILGTHIPRCAGAVQF